MIEKYNRVIVIFFMVFFGVVGILIGARFDFSLDGKIFIFIISSLIGIFYGYWIGIILVTLIILIQEEIKKSKEQ